MENQLIIASEKESTQLLYKFFCNNIRLGQWEFASLCARKIAYCHPNEPEAADIRRILKDIAYYPYDRSLGAPPTISSCHHLSWLCLAEYEKMLQHQNIEFTDKEQLTRDVEFRLLLSEIADDSSTDAIQELYNLHSLLWFPEECSGSNQEKHVTQELLDFMRHFLFKQPSLGNHIIHSLAVSANCYDKTKAALWQTYFDVIVDILGRLSESNVTVGDDVDKLYKLLATAMFSTCDDVKQITVIFQHIVEICNSDGVALLSKYKVISSLLGYSDTVLIDLFLDLDHEFTARKLIDRSALDAIELDHDRKLLIASVINGDRRVLWKNLFHLCLVKKKHFLSEIVEVCMELIKSRQFDILPLLLNHADFSPLKPLVLLMGWKYCYIFSDACTLLSLLHEPKTEGQRGLLDAGVDRLSYQIDIIHWCLDKTKDISGRSGNVHNQMISEIFENLESQSVLSILHKCTRLSTLDPSDVLDLLHNSPRQADQGQQKKVVRFADASDQTEYYADHLSDRQVADISLYHSYCAVVRVMEAIYFCQKGHTENSDEGTETFTRFPSSQSTSTRNLSTSSSSTVGGSDTNFAETATSRYSVEYNENVTKKLSQVKDHLAHVFPLNYRLEVLENIFSLLFVTHESLKEDNDEYESDSGALPEDTSISGSVTDVSVTETPSIKPTSVISPDKMASAATNFTYDEPFVDNRTVPRLLSDSNVEKPKHKGSKSNQGQSNWERVPHAKQASVNDGTKSSNCESSQYRSGSTPSGSSTPEVHKLGFLANEFVTRDIIHLLKVGLIDLGTDKIKLQGSSKSRVRLSGIQPSLMKLIPCSIPEASTQKRLTRLNHYVSEAHWRYQLVAHSSVPRAAGETTRRVSFESTDCDLDDFAQYVPRKRRASNKKKKISSGGESDLNTDVSRESNRSHGHRRSSRPIHINMTPQMYHHDIISTMLSSHKSLLNICLRRGHHVQALQVIKLFNLDTSREALEVRFANLFSDTRQKLLNCDIKPPDTTIDSSASGPINLRHLANVAAAGIAISTVSNITDSVLDPSLIPAIIPPKNFAQLSPQYKELFNNDNLMTMVALDLAISVNKNWRVCSNLLDTAKSYLRFKHPGVEVKTSGRDDKFHLKGYLGYMKDLDSFVNYALNSDSADITTSEQNVMKELIGEGPESMSTGQVYPLDIDDCMKYVSAISVISRSVTKAEKAMNDFWNGTDTPMSDSSIRKNARQSEQPVNHFAVRQLIGALEKHIPPGGILQYVSRTPAPAQGERPYYNYMLSLYDHLKELAFLVAESEKKPGDTKLVPPNYFSLLRQGPITMIGKLMFVKKMFPTRLEKVAKKLNVNLMHIIVRSCCPTVPCKSLPPPTPPVHPGVREEGQGRLVLNGGSEWLGEVQAPQACVQSLITHVRHVMKDIADKNNADGVFNDQCRDELANSLVFDDITAATRELSCIDLDMLTSHKDKICFFSNLHNLMTIHMWLYRSWRKAKQDTRKSIVPSNLDDIINYNSLSYHVGQLGVISINDLRQYFCGSQQTCDRKDLDPSDPWLHYIPARESKLVYVVSDGCLSSPPLQVLSPEMVHSQLLVAMKSYLNNTVSINVDNRRVTVPALLLSHYHDAEIPGIFSSRDEALVNFIATLVTEETQEKMVQLLRGTERLRDSSSGKAYPVVVTEKPFCNSFLYTFDYETLKKYSQISPNQHRRSSSLPPDLESIEQETLPADDKYQQVYHLTPITLEYVKESSSLVATLVSLVCSDEIDDIEFSFMDDHFLDSRRILKRSMSEISLVDIRSYRYSKLTNDYPALKRHILSTVVPLAAAYDPEIAKCDDPILKLMTSTINDKLKGCMMNHPGNDEFMSCIFRLVTEFINNHNWSSVVEIFQAISDVTMLSTPHLQILHDHFLSKTIAAAILDSQTSRKRAHDDALPPMFVRFYDKAVQSRVVLRFANCVPMETAVDIVRTCVYEPAVSESMKAGLRVKLNELIVHRTVLECFSNMKLKLSTQTASLSRENEQEKNASMVSQLNKLCDWFNLQLASPSLVLKLLLDGHEFDAARDWVELKGLDDGQETDKAYVIHALRQDPPQVLNAFYVLERYQNADVTLCFKLCYDLLDDITHFDDIIFIAHFMLEHMVTAMTSEKIDKLRLLYIGARFLQNIPKFLHSAYSHLVSQPKLILEQLIMNTKVELAGQLYAKMKSDFDLIVDPQHNFSSAQFSDLVAWYAGKALEFAVVQTETRTQESDVTSPISQDNLSASGSQSILSTLHRYDSAKSIATRRNRDYGRRLSAGFSPVQKVGLSISPVITTPLKQPFFMPPEAPKRSQWVPDSDVPICMVCEQEHFSMFSRRHHCRRCGRVVCGGCSKKTIVLNGMSVRACNDCYRLIYKPRRQASQTARLPDPMCSPPRLRSNSVVSNIGEESASDLQKLIRHTEHEWKLNLIEDYNTIVRDDFYYEQSPSAPLCISLVALLGDGQRAGHLMLKFCDDLSHMLRPIAPGVPNPEVDYTLVISMMRHILLHAKMNFIEHGEHDASDGQGLSMCEVYLSRIDLLYLLISSNVPDLPSLNELSSLDVTRRLRDKLTENERLPLAIEVSTKCGLDSAGVWGRWGKTCLEMGDYMAAREKFSRCLKVPLDRNLNITATKTLRDIVDFLENAPSEGDSDILMLLKGASSIKQLVSLPPPRYSEETSLSSPAIQECLYYLKTYGTYGHIVGFYQRHGYLMKAAQYILDHKCSQDTFVSHLLIPCLNCGHLAILQDQMVMIDLSLDRWGPYLTAACRYFMKAKLIHVLYQFQLFMKDYIRAAMTCITYFYQGGATSYHDLAARNSYLTSARAHMESYLDPRQWGSVRPPNLPSSKTLTASPDWQKDKDPAVPVVRLVQSVDEVRRNIAGVNMQILVSDYLKKSLPPSPIDSDTGATPTATPTLFGNAKMRAELVNFIMQNGNDVAYSFDLCLRIVKQYRLSFVPILANAAHEMAKQHEYVRIDEMLACLKHHEMDGDDTVDNIVGSCVIVLADDASQSKPLDSLIKSLRSNSNKINAMILCGKLRPAYLLAVRLDRVDDVRRIAGAAQRTGQTLLTSICDKYLTQKDGNPPSDDSTT